MKLVTLLLGLVVLPAIRSQAQDIIVKNDKSELTVKVDEITAQTVKFHYFSRLTGPVYNLDKSEVFMIIYKDGNRESFKTAAAAPADPPTPAARPVTTPTASLAKEVPANVSQPVAEAPVAPFTAATASAPVQKTPKTQGWAYGLGYMTLTQAFAQVHGYTATWGYYKLLGPNRNAALLFDVAGMDFFGKDKPTFYSLTANGLLRLGATSRAYIGSGLGYGVTFVPLPVYDRYGTVTSRSTASVGGACGSAFIGVGMVRAGIMLPSLGSSASGLFTVGFYTNPF